MKEDSGSVNKLLGVLLVYVDDLLCVIRIGFVGKVVERV